MDGPRPPPRPRLPSRRHRRRSRRQSRHCVGVFLRLVLGGVALGMPGGGGGGLAAAVDLQLRGSLGAGAGADAGYSSERGFCELCMHTIHQVQYGSLPSCAQSTKSFGSCSQTVQVILGQAASVLQLIEEGCYQYDSYKDWQTIKPCPSHAICGRLHNNFDADLATLCPKDFHFRFPTALGQAVPNVQNPLLPYAIDQLYETHDGGSHVRQDHSNVVSRNRFFHDADSQTLSPTNGVPPQVLSDASGLLQGVVESPFFSQ